MSWFGWGGEEQKKDEKASQSSSWLSWATGSDQTVGQDEGCSVSVDVCLDVITDYAKYPEFLSDMYETKILKQDGDSMTVYYSLNLKFTTVEYVLQLTKTKTGVSWIYVELGPFQKNDGSWTLVEKDGKTHATYTVDVAFTIYVPGFMKDYAVGSSLPSTMDAFKKRIETINQKLKESKK